MLCFSDLSFWKRKPEDCYLIVARQRESMLQVLDLAVLKMANSKVDRMASFIIHHLWLTLGSFGNMAIQVMQHYIGSIKEE